MNSRERVLCALNHQEPDRVPIDLGGTRQSGIAASTYHQLKQRLGLDTPTRVYDLYQMLAEVEQPVLERFGADVVGLNRPAVAFGIRNENWKPWTLFDGTPVEVPGGFNPEVEPDGDLLLLRPPTAGPMARMPKGGFYFDRLDKYPGAAHADPETLQPPLLTQEECDHLHAQAEAYCAEHRPGDRRRDGPALRAVLRPGHRRFPGLDDHPGHRAGLRARALRAAGRGVAGEPAAVHGGGGRPRADPPVQRRPGHAGRPVPLGRACSASGSCPTTSAGWTGSTSTRG